MKNSESRVVDRAVIRSSQLKMQATFGPTARFEYPTELRQAHGPLSQTKREVETFSCSPRRKENRDRIYIATLVYIGCFKRSLESFSII